MSYINGKSFQFDVKELKDWLKDLEKVRVFGNLSMNLEADGHVLRFGFYPCTIDGGHDYNKDTFYFLLEEEK